MNQGRRKEGSEEASLRTQPGGSYLGCGGGRKSNLDFQVAHAWCAPGQRGGQCGGSG